MKKLYLMLASLVLTLSMSSLAQATVNWQLVYSSDFSTDPGWTTNAPGKMYWDPVSQRYHLERDRAEPEEYTYVKIPAVVVPSPTCGSETTYSPRLSYKLEYDIQVIRSDWAGEIPFGLSDKRMTWDCSAQGGALAWAALYSNGDNEYGANVQYSSDSACGGVGGVGAPGQLHYELNVAYHNTLISDPMTESLMWEVIRVSDGKIMQNVWKSDVGTFTGIDRLFCGSLNVDYGGGTGQAWIDNVVLSAAPCVPEPATVLLVGLGGLALRRRRKRM